METSESNTHSFVVKLWLEEIDDDRGAITWRGHITHVQSGARRYVQDLKGIADFIATYLETMGARPGVRRRVREWINRQKLLLTGRG